MLYQFIKKGALSQVTAASIEGKLGKNVAKFANQILESNLAHFVASDAHNTTNRGFYLKEAYTKIKKQYGRDMEYMLLENSLLLSQGKNVMKDIPQRIKKKKVLGLF